MSVVVKWLGHASFQIRADDKIIYIDPYEGEYREKADVVLVTHSHHDHCDISKIRRLIKEGTVIVCLSDCASKIPGNVKVIKPGETTTIDDLTIEAVQAYNIKRFRSPGNPFHPKGLGVGYVITVAGKRIYHAGDTDFIPEMKSLSNISLALLPSGGTYTMDNPEAAEAALAIRPDVAIPIHRWDTSPEAFKKKVESSSDIKVVILEPGEEYKMT